MRGTKENMRIHVLGCGSAKPTLRHQPACTVLEHRGTLYMIDCGEGAQLAFQRARLNPSRLSHIFLTHLHGDHVLGLPGLISTFGMGQVGGIITIHTFEDGARMLRKMIDFFSPMLSFEIKWDIISPEEKVILNTPSLTVRTVPLLHRVPDVGYIFEEKEKLRHLRADMCEFHNVPVTVRRSLAEGADYLKPDGTVIPNAALTTPADHSASYAHISDTRYLPDLASKIGPVDLLYHETTYLERDAADARARFHSTAAQAAMTARDAGAKRLLTGHYSSRYKNEEEFVKEASAIFPESLLNNEGLILKI